MFLSPVLWIALQDDQQVSAMVISALADNLSQRRVPVSPLDKAEQRLKHIFCLNGPNVFWISIDSPLLASADDDQSMERKMK